MLNSLFQNSVKFIECDITIYAQLLAAFKTALKFPPSGTLSHVFANAGCVGTLFQYPKESDESDPPEPSLASTQVSLVAMYNTVYLGIHFMASSKPGNRSIILTGSILSYIGLPFIVDYAMSKHGVRAIFKCLRANILQESGIRLNMIAPTFIATPLTQAISKDSFKFAPLEHVTKAVERLLADEKAHGK
jgi:5'-hydroxyaverantin dehydrogenase